MVETIGIAVASGQGGLEVTLGGKAYTLADLTLGDLAELQEWVTAHLPDPLKVARELAEGLPADLAKEILLAAYEDVRRGARRLGTPEADKVLQSTAGWLEMLYLRGRKHQPDMTRESWEPLLLEMLTRATEVLQGVLAEGSGGALSAPKVPASSEAPTETSLTAENSTTGSPADSAGLHKT